MTKKYIGATIIAMIVFWVLNFGNSLLIERQTMVYAFFSALIKAPIFAFIFHIIHNFIARILGWYQGENI